MKKTELCRLPSAGPGAPREHTVAKVPSPAKVIVQPAKSPLPIGPYSHAVRFGNLLFCSGQIPLDARTGKIAGGDDIRAQTDRVLRNLQAILDQEKLAFAHVLKTMVYLTNLEDFAAFNEVYGHYFAKDPPARSTVQVAALPRGAKVEIEAIACYPTS